MIGTKAEALAIAKAWNLRPPKLGKGRKFVKAEVIKLPGVVPLRNSKARDYSIWSVVIRWTPIIKSGPVLKRRH